MLIWRPSTEGSSGTFVAWQDMTGVVIGVRFRVHLLTLYVEPAKLRA